MIFLILKQRQGLFTWALDTLKKIKIRIPFFENRRDKILETDAISPTSTAGTPAFPGPVRVLFRQAWLWARVYLPSVPGGADLLQGFLIVTLGSFYSFPPARIGRRL
jgi:hypothetical protein